MRFSTAIVASAGLVCVLVAGPAAAQGYGQAVLVSGNEVLVGESLYTTRPGYVYIYRKSGSRWVEATKLQASDAAPNDHFGRTLTLAEGDLLVSATVARQSGVLYVFSRDGDSWRETAALLPSDAHPQGSFGRVSVTDGHSVMLSSWASDSSRGAVYVFEKQNGAWRETAKLRAGDGEPNDWFGFSMAIAGDRLAIGASRRERGRGAVYLFRRSGGSWQETARLMPPDTAANTGFGSAVAFAGDALLISAPGADGFVGAIYGYRADANGTWTQAARVTPPAGTTPNNTFGSVLQTVGDEVWAGAPGIDTGRMYRLTKAADGNWQSVVYLGARDLQPGDGFAGALDVNGSLAVAGVVGDDFGLGSAVIYEKSNNNWSESARLVTEVKGLDPIVGNKVDCTGGKASLYDCGDVDIMSFLPVQQVGGGRGVQLNDLWGWTNARTGKEWALVGRVDGTSFIDLSDPNHPVYVGDLPLTKGARPSIWRDIKVYRDHAYIVSDGSGPHGMQVFDLTRLRNVPRSKMPMTFTEDAHYDHIASAHNIVINEATGFAYAVGANSGGETCGGGLHMIDIREPAKPKFAGCFQDTQTGIQRTGYTHDAQCVVYHGPDAKFKDHEICMGANETMLSIADVTDKSKPVSLARAGYPSVGYAHQGWLDEQHEYFYMDDETDEISGNIQHTRTLVWDVKDLEDPVLVKEYFGPSTSSDHNLYVRGNLVYESNYVSGLRIIDISNRTDPKEVGFFDTVPGNDAPGFDGSWSNYPFFASGTIVVTSMKEGVFFLRRHTRAVS